MSYDSEWILLIMFISEKPIDQHYNKSTSTVYEKSWVCDSNVYSEDNVQNTHNMKW